VNLRFFKINPKLVGGQSKSSRGPPVGHRWSRTLQLYHIRRKKYYERSVGKDLEGLSGPFLKALTRHVSGDYDDNHEVCSQHIWQRGWNLKAATTMTVLKMETTGSFEMPDPTYQTTWYHTTEVSVAWCSPQRKPPVSRPPLLISYADVWQIPNSLQWGRGTNCEAADVLGQRNLSV
jgi:hypothetical protein